MSAARKPAGRRKAAPEGTKLKPLPSTGATIAPSTAATLAADVSSESGSSLHTHSLEGSCSKPIRRLNIHTGKSRSLSKSRSLPQQKMSVDALLNQTIMNASAARTRSQSVEDISTLLTIGVSDSRLKHSAATAASSEFESYSSDEDDDFTVNSAAYSHISQLTDHSSHHSHQQHRRHLVHGYSPAVAAVLGYSSALASNRSIGSQSSIGSDYSSTLTHRTQRELLNEINTRAANNLSPPSFLRRLEELTPEQISWDKKMPRSNDNRQMPINILPCLQPVELLLIKADLRTRKRQRNQQLRQQKMDEQVARIDAGIQYKFSRAERYAAIAAHRFRQMTFLKLIVVTSFLHNLQAPFRHKLKMQIKFQRSVLSGMTIERYCRHWYRRHLFIKYHLKFLRMMKRSDLKFRIFLRVRRKRLAVQKLTCFLHEFRHHHKMNVVVHKYLMAVRKVQRNIRAFLACKRSKVDVLSMLWDKIEKQFVDKMLSKRRAKKRQTGKIRKLETELQAVVTAAAAANSSNGSVGSGSSAATAAAASFSAAMGQDVMDMKAQAQLWSKIDAVMEAKLQQLKKSGVLESDSIEKAVEQHQLPHAIRNTLLRELLTELRREFYGSQRAMVRRKLDVENAFGANHAAEMLRGENSNIDRIFREKFDKKLVRLNYKPFMLFSAIDNKLIYERVIAAHKKYGTFDIKIDQFSSSNSSNTDAAAGLNRAKSMRRKLTY